ncbi:hypothetical protein E3N88_43106 [Mikania micrantha]|uniref:Retroviral polymerase SH3-like domain-containing protein n=1 Tax=Mikania micrantha TaxID=192012 RepID=A0A5N6LFW4_9ASTR|nr:hypothetical protein E3N88_43106 [Mikania micrantha]
MPSRHHHNTSPFEFIFKHKPDLTFLRVFGCHCYPHLRPYNKHKMDFRSTPCVFLGYGTLHHGYRCFDPSSDRIYIARHVRFHESSFPFTPQPPESPSLPPDPYVSFYPDPPTVSIPAQTTNLPTPPIIHTYHRRNRPPQPSTTNPSRPPTTEDLPTTTDPTISPDSPTTIEPPVIITEPSPTSSAESLPSDPPNPPCSRPSNLRPNPKPTKPYIPSSFHTTARLQAKF